MIPRLRNFRDRWNALPRPVHVGLAVVLCALTTLFALIWMYDRRHPNPHTVEIGFNPIAATFFDPATSSIPIYSVARGSPAEQAGCAPAIRSSP